MSSRIFLILLLALVVGASMIFQGDQLETFTAIQKEKEKEALEMQTMKPATIVAESRTL